MSVCRYLVRLTQCIPLPCGHAYSHLWGSACVCVVIRLSIRPCAVGSPAPAYARNAVTPQPHARTFTLAHTRRIYLTSPCRILTQVNTVTLGREDLVRMSLATQIRGEITNMPSFEVTTGEATASLYTVPENVMFATMALPSLHVCGIPYIPPFATRPTHKSEQTRSSYFRVLVYCPREHYVGRLATHLRTIGPD